MLKLVAIIALAVTLAFAVHGAASAASPCLDPSSDDVRWCW
jgi:hypothetical protein